METTQATPESHQVVAIQPEAAPSAEDKPTLPPVAPESILRQQAQTHNVTTELPTQPIDPIQEAPTTEARSSLAIPKEVIAKATSNVVSKTPTIHNKSDVTVDRPKPIIKPDQPVIAQKSELAKPPEPVRETQISFDNPESATELPPLTAKTITETAETDSTWRPPETVTTEVIAVDAMDDLIASAFLSSELTETEALANAMETFWALTELAELPIAPVISEALDEDQLVELQSGTAELITPTRFEAFVDTRLDEPAVDLETIQATANEQPLEETLAQLAIYLSEAAALEATEIVELLQAVEVELPSLSLDGVVEKPQVTLELTQKLLVLLDAVGYQNPQEALTDLVRRHDLEFLMESINYLCERTNDHVSFMEQEFLPHHLAAFVSPTPSVPVTTRLGWIILGLIQTRRLAIT